MQQLLYSAHTENYNRQTLRKISLSFTALTTTILTKAEGFSFDHTQEASLKYVHILTALLELFFSKLTRTDSLPILHLNVRN